MLKYLNCMFVDRRLKAGSPEDEVVATPPKAAPQMTISNQAATTGSSTTDCTTSVASVSVSADCACLAPGHLSTLPQATSHIGISFRLFASTGKLLVHVEDDLELFPSGGIRGIGSPVIRDPIAVSLPLDNQQQPHRNNSFFDRCQQEKRSVNTHTAAFPSLEDSTATTSSLTLSTRDTIKTVAALSDRKGFYYGSICALLRELRAAPLPEKKAASAVLGNGSSMKLRACRRHPESSARRSWANRGGSVLSPVLLEPDGLSGRTVPIGCVPSVPVARSRLVTHMSEFKMSYMYSGL